MDGANKQRGCLRANENIKNTYNQKERVGFSWTHKEEEGFGKHLAQIIASVREIVEAAGHLPEELV